MTNKIEITKEYIDELIEQVGCLDECVTGNTWSDMEIKDRIIRLAGYVEVLKTLYGKQN